MSWFEKLVIVLVLSLFVLLWPSKDARADYLYTGAWSQHLDSKEDYNETHELLAYQWENDYHPILGRFMNSHNNPTTFIGISTTPVERWDIQLSAIVGLMYGYRECFGGGHHGDDAAICPLIAPTIAYTKWSFQPTVMVMGNAIALTFRWGI